MMIQSKDLRIGNLVYYQIDRSTFKLGEIRCLNLKKATIRSERGGIKYYNLFSIPLTEKILLDNGFEKVQDFSVNSELEKEYYYINRLTLRKNKYSGFYEFHFQHANPSMYENVEVKYVHQLQNIYYLLTGIELEIKL